MKYQKIKIYDIKAAQKSLFKIDEEIESLDSIKSSDNMDRNESFEIFRKDKYENQERI